MPELLSRDTQHIASLLEKEHNLATIVGYGCPIEVTWYAINLGLFEGLPTRMRKSGKQCVRFRDVDEYEIKMNVPNLAVVTSFYPHVSRGNSDIQRVEPYKDGFIIKPINHAVDMLPGQRGLDEQYEEIDLESWDGDSLPRGSSNSLESDSISGTAKNHATLVERLLSLEGYDPKILYDLIQVPIENLSRDEIPTHNITSRS